MIKKTLKKIKLGIINSLPVKYKFSPNRLCWCKEKGGRLNFGDQIGPYLLKRLTKTEIIYCKPKNITKYTTLVTAGSIMTTVKRNTIVWGTGIMRRNDIFYKPLRVIAVRGPLTRKRFKELGYYCPKSYGDPGLLLPKFYPKRISKEYKIGIVPHFVDLKYFGQFKQKNIIIIDVEREVEKVIDEICKCELILSSSLHGCIVSNAYGIPCAWIKVSNDILGDDTKFFDYFYSVGAKSIKPIDLRNKKIMEIDFQKYMSLPILPENIREIQNSLYFTINLLMRG